MIKFNFYLYWMTMLMIMSLISLYNSILLIYKNYSILIEWEIFEINSFMITYVMFFDWISCLFMSVVLFISSMVIFYSINYMGITTYSSNRFLFLVVLFVFSMMLMIISPDLISIMLGWDGLGMISYCLVIYYNSTKSYTAGMITCLTNRLGDIGLLISMSWMMSYGSWHFIYYLNHFNQSLFYLIFISSFTKSAQIPFSTWLPAAMAAPTPVSALVHSSTLVTAGVYILIRFFSITMYKNFYMLFLSMLTMFMSSICANYEFDLKKIIALSTLSQLGLMMSSLFMGLVEFSFFHLLTHAMFKSLLFLCAGIYIFYMNDNQDIRIMGSVSMTMPMVTSCFNISSMALCGIPFLSGFYSKDLILEMSILNSNNMLFCMMFYICLGLTCMYSMRLIYYSMILKSKFMNQLLFFEENKFMKISILILTMYSVFFGCLILWILLIDLNLILIPIYIKIMPIILILLGMFIGYQINKMNNFIFNLTMYYFMNMWFMFSYSNYLYKLFFKFSLNLKLGMNWGEFYGAMGLSYYLLYISNMIQTFSMNNIKILLISFMIWFSFMI
nr:NADH dehydrogenase subunit 5 [Kaukania anser]